MKLSKSEEDRLLISIALMVIGSAIGGYVDHPLALIAALIIVGFGIAVMIRIFRRHSGDNQDS